MSSISLSVGELIEICEFMGVDIPDVDRYSEDHLEEEFTIHENRKGTIVFDEETGEEEKYRIVITCDGCDYDEVQPIGEEVL